MAHPRCSNGEVLVVESESLRLSGLISNLREGLKLNSCAYLKEEQGSFHSAVVKSYS